MSKTVVFERRLNDGSTFILGHAVEKTDGWRFYPNATSRSPSRKSWPTMEACLPRWLGYPERCESRVTRGAKVFQLATHKDRAQARLKLALAREELAEKIAAFKDALDLVADDDDMTAAEIAKAKASIARGQAHLEEIAKAIDEASEEGGAK